MTGSAKQSKGRADKNGLLRLARNDGRASIHIHLQAFLLDDGCELLGLGIDKIRKLLRRAVVGSRAHRGDVSLGVLALEEHLDLLVEGVDDGGGRALPQE